jgi:hypothetical protein
MEYTQLTENFNGIDLNKLKTGDIILFDEKPNNFFFKTFTKLIKFWTKSIYSHCGFILKDPFGLKGLYIWESSWHKNVYDPLDNKNKFGVQITPIDYYLNNYPGNVNIYIRVKSDDNISKKMLDNVQNIVNNKPYDYNLGDWICIAFGLKRRRTIKRFWCSALVSYILCINGDIDENTDWTMTTAKDLSSNYNTCIKWNSSYSEDLLLGYF